MNNLIDIRKKINEIDAVIISKFEERMNCVKQVAKYKYENNLPVIDIVREDAIIQQSIELISDNKDESLKSNVEYLMKFLMKLSRDAQQRTISKLRNEKIIAYQGEPGANSQRALHDFFGKNANAVAFNTFNDVFDAVEQDKAEFGVIPIENTSTGAIIQIYDLLGCRPLFIVGEQSIPIIHSLLGLKGANIQNLTDIYSHEQAFLQCNEFLKDKHFTLHPYFNTATSAKYVSELNDFKNAAIASPYAAEIYGLDILNPNISDKANNTTRFIIISKFEYLGEDANKVSIIFSLKHRPGSLSDVLKIFAQHGLNMVKIESRPMANVNFQYLFYVDFEGKGIKDSIENIIRTHRSLFEDFKLLGAYKKWNKNE